jgi:hypothetical protein
MWAKPVTGFGLDHTQGELRLTVGAT